METSLDLTHHTVAPITNVISQFILKVIRHFPLSIRNDWDFHRSLFENPPCATFDKSSISSSASNMDICFQIGST